MTEMTKYTLEGAHKFVKPWIAIISYRNILLSVQRGWDIGLIQAAGYLD
jgi:hypothetical protein